MKEILLGFFLAENGDVNVNISSISVPGEYSATAAFRITFDSNTMRVNQFPAEDDIFIEEIYEYPELQIRTTVVE